MNADEQPLRKPANENAWYCLATVYGEFTEESRQNWGDNNRISWNRWMAGWLKEEKRNELVELGFERSELMPFTERERAEFFTAFEKRSPLPLPSFDDSIEFGNTVFDNCLYFNRYIFPGGLKMNNCLFRKEISFINCYMPVLDMRDSTIDQTFFC